MFIEPTITWVPSGLCVYIGLTQKIVLKNLVLPINTPCNRGLMKQYAKPTGRNSREIVKNYYQEKNSKSYPGMKSTRFMKDLFKH